MTHRKSISVAMCTYNGEKYVLEQLESIAKQTRLPDEIVIFDDCSKDSTVKIIEEFSKRSPFPVRLHVNPVNIGASSKGITKNFEQATKLCTGELIVPCDQDDIWVPQKLARMAGIMEERPELGGLFSDAQLVTDKGVPKGVLLSQTTGLSRSEQRRLAAGDALPLLMSMTKVYGSSLMFDARLVRKILPVPPNWWFDAWVACMAAVHAKLAFVPEELYLYRIHANQSVSASLPTMSARVGRWKRSAQDYREASEPPLKDLYAHLEAEHDPKMEPYMQYVQGRIDLLKFRTELPGNRILRSVKVMGAMGEYHRYFNGWRSIVKDMTA